MLSREKKTGKPVSYYEVLQVSQQATDTDIRRAYYKLAKLFHPDRHPHEKRLAELRFRLINDAYANLRTKDKRLQYNRMFRQEVKSFRAMKKAAGNDNFNPVQNRKTFLGIMGDLFGLSKNSQSNPL